MMKGKKIAIVTGATGGLGREFVRLLLKEKNVDEIWALARNEKKLSRLKDKFGKKIKIYSIDLSSVRQIKCFGEELHEEAGGKIWRFLILLIMLVLQSFVLMGI